MGCAEAESEVAVGLDFGGAVAGGVDDEGHLLVVGLEPFAGEALEVVRACDEGLAGEYVAAEVFGGLGGDFVFEVAGVDGGSARPYVAGDDEVVMDAGDVVVGHG